jgi:hypothetical protein
MNRINKMGRRSTSILLVLLILSLPVYFGVGQDEQHAQD